MSVLPPLIAARPLDCGAGVRGAGSRRDGARRWQQRR